MALKRLVWLVLGSFAIGSLCGFLLAQRQQKAPDVRHQAVAEHPTVLPRIVVRPEYRARGPRYVPEGARGLYLDAMKLALTGLLDMRNPRDIRQRAVGRDWPGEALTMIGLKRLDNLHMCAESVLERKVPGDFLEAGAWRGGASIFMRAVLKEYGVTDRVVWVADSFEGVPAPDPAKYPADKGMELNRYERLAVSLDEVRWNFERVGLLDDQVHFLKGWFKDTLPTAPVHALAILRLDGDLYESTMETLVPLYSKVSKGGYIIADDYYSIGASRQAIDDFRGAHGITAPIERIDWTGAYWQKTD